MGKIFKFLGRILSTDYITAGPNNVINNDDCTALGSNLESGGNNQILLGKYNEVMNGDYPLIVGNGTNENRKNILSLSKDGNLVIPGNFTPNGYNNLPKYIKNISFNGYNYSITYSDGEVVNGTLPIPESFDDKIQSGTNPPTSDTQGDLYFQYE